MYPIANPMQRLTKFVDACTTRRDTIIEMGQSSRLGGLQLGSFVPAPVKLRMCRATA